jgi:hypothetical protein
VLFLWINTTPKELKLSKQRFESWLHDRIFHGHVAALKSQGYGCLLPFASCSPLTRAAAL